MRSFPNFNALLNLLYCIQHHTISFQRHHSSVYSHELLRPTIISALTRPEHWSYETWRSRWKSDTCSDSNYYCTLIRHINKAPRDIQYGGNNTIVLDTRNWRITTEWSAVFGAILCLASLPTIISSECKQHSFLLLLLLLFVLQPWCSGDDLVVVARWVFIPTAAESVICIQATIRALQGFRWLTT